MVSVSCLDPDWYENWFLKWFQELDTPNENLRICLIMFLDLNTVLKVCTSNPWHAMSCRLIKLSPTIDCDEVSTKQEPKKLLDLTIMAVMMTIRNLVWMNFPIALEFLQKENSRLRDSESFYCSPKRIFYFFVATRLTLLKIKCKI